MASNETERDRASHIDSVVTLSLLTCQPGGEAYSLYGHTAIHYVNKEKGLDIAVNYGSRAEIVKAAQEIAVMVRNGTIRAEEINEQTISDHLYTGGQPDVDLLIRTSGEKRLSNFLLYQNAYAEFVFPETLWPDFSVHDYDLALDAFGRRQRRYGGR